MYSEDWFIQSTRVLVRKLDSLYSDWEGKEQFLGTPERLSRMYFDYCWSLTTIKKELDKQFRAFENQYNEMVTVGPIDVWVLCPHHLLPCHLEVIIGCIPEGKVLGVSKFARVAEILGKRPIMQEQYSTELANEIHERLKPKGTAVSILGSHDCMTTRGVKQKSKVVTSSLLGCFLGDASAKSEFFQSVERLSRC